MTYSHGGISFLSEICLSRPHIDITLEDHKEHHYHYMMDASTNCNLPPLS